MADDDLRYGTTQAADAPVDDEEPDDDEDEEEDASDDEAND